MRLIPQAAVAKRCRHRGVVTSGSWWARYRDRVHRAATGQVLEIGAPAELAYQHARFLAVVPARGEVVSDAGEDVLVAAAPAEQLPFPSGTFDVVVCTLSLCCAEDPSGLVREVARVLRPHGHVEFLEHSPGAGGLSRTRLIGVRRDRCRAHSDPLVLLLGGGLVIHRVDVVRSGATSWQPLVRGTAAHAGQDASRELGALLGGRNTGS